MSRELALRKLIAKLPGVSSDGTWIQCSIESLVAALAALAAEPGAASGAQPCSSVCIGCEEEYPLVNGQHYRAGTGMFYPCTKLAAPAVKELSEEQVREEYMGIDWEHLKGEGWKLLANRLNALLRSGGKP